MIIVSAQRTADRIFRSLIEDWRPRLERVDGVGLAMSELVSDGKPQPLSLPGWTGIYDGVQRLDGLLCTVQAFISSTSSTAVVLQVSSIMDLTDRILSILQPSGARGSRIRPEVGRDEREGLGAGLAQLHVSAMAILSLMISRLGSGCAATKERTLEQVLWVLQDECANDEVRRAAYGVVSQILMRFGLSLPVSCAVPISLCIRACCEDVVSLEEASAQGKEGPALSGTRRPDTNADSFLKSAKTPLKNVTASEPTIEAAERLLPLALTNLPSGFLSYALRARIDKTAILAGNKNAMLASVMNPHGSIKGKQSNTSILPLLARAHFGALDVETLLRPQMPTVQSPRKHDGDGRLEEEEEEEQAYEPGFQDALRPNTFGFGSNYSSDRIAEREGGRALASDDPHEAQEISMTATGGADSAQPGIDLLKSQASHMPGKRNREIDVPLEAETGNNDPSIATKTIQSEEEISIKRARLTTSEPEQNQEKDINLDDIVLDGPSTTNIATPKPSMTQTTEGAGAKFPDDPVDSDESDFEMPTLYLGPDTDEEDEGEEEDDE